MNNLNEQIKEQLGISIDLSTSDGERATKIYGGTGDVLFTVNFKYMGPENSLVSDKNTRFSRAELVGRVQEFLDLRCPGYDSESFMSVIEELLGMKFDIGNFALSNKYPVTRCVLIGTPRFLILFHNESYVGPN